MKILNFNALLPSLYIFSRCIYSYLKGWFVEKGGRRRARREKERDLSSTCWFTFKMAKNEELLLGVLQETGTQNGNHVGCQHCSQWILLCNVTILALDVYFPLFPTPAFFFFFLVTYFLGTQKCFSTCIIFPKVNLSF